MFKKKKRKKAGSTYCNCIIRHMTAFCLREVMHISYIYNIFRVRYLGVPKCTFQGSHICSLPKAYMGDDYVLM